MAGVALLAPGFVGASPADEAPPAFNASAAASGIRLTVKSTNVPLTDTPIEGGGPTAQVVAESAGTSQGYAAVPDPGPIVIGGPAILAGVLAGGIPGVLPPTEAPPLPGYPFYVQSDATTAPEQQLDSGPVQLSASSTPGTSTASAKMGFKAGEATSLGSATSTADVGPTGSTVVAKAVSRIEGFTAGPLTIAAVTSLATETLDATGKLTPSTELRIDGMKIGDQSVGLDPEGFGSGSSKTPVPLNSSLESILKASGISIRFVAGQTYPNYVVAPALEVSMPFDSREIPGVGQYKGTVTLTIGRAAAAMTPAGGQSNPVPETTTDQTAGPSTAPDTTSDDTGGNPTGPPAGDSTAPAAGASLSGDIGRTALGFAASRDPRATTSAAATPDAFATDSFAIGEASEATPNTGTSATAPPSVTGSPSDVAAGPLTPRTLASASGPSRLDVRGVYLMGVLAVIAAVVGGQGLRRLGRTG